jgi:SET domain-containing protein
MAPIVDMINHSRHINCQYYYDGESQHFVVKATKDIKRGEQLLDTYGPQKTANTMLMEYGFFEDRVSYDFEIVLRPEKHANWADKVALVGEKRKFVMT